MIVGAVAAVLVLVVVAIVAVTARDGDDERASEPSPRRSGPSRYVVLSGPKEDGLGDLELMDLDGIEAPIPLTTDARFEPIGPLDDTDGYEPTPDIVWVGRELLIGWGDDTSTTAVLIDPTSERPAPRTVYDGPADASLTYDATSGRLLVNTYEDDEAQCWSAPLGEPPEVIARGDQCWFTSERTVVTSSPESDDPDDYEGPRAVSVRDLDGTELAAFTAPGWLSDTDGAEGSRAFSTSTDELVVHDLATGDQVARAEGPGMTTLGRGSDDGDLLFATTGDGAAILRLLHPDGTDEEIVRGAGVTGELLPDGTIVAAVEAADGAVTVSRRAPGDDRLVPLVSDVAELRFATIDQDEPAIVAWVPGGPVWVGGVAGELTRIGVLGDDETPDAAVFDPATERGYLATYDAEGDDSDGTGVVYAIDGRLVEALDGWEGFSIEHWSGDTVIVQTYGDQGAALYRSTGDGPMTEIEQAPYIETSTVLDDALLYTTYAKIDDFLPTGPPTSRRLLLGGTDPATTLVEGRSVEGSTEAGTSVDLAYLFEDEEEDLMYWTRPPATCADAEPLQLTSSGQVGAGRILRCLEVPAGGASITIDVDASTDTFLTITDELGEQIAYSDDETEDDLDPRIEVDLEPGRYVVELANYEPGDTGSYEMTVTLG